MPLEIVGVSYIYNKGLSQEHTALKNITMTIPANSFVAIIGHTGSGKSTLMQIMNGLLKPTEGIVLFNGEDVHSGKLSKKMLRQKVGLVFQYPEHQLFEETVFKDVAFGPQNMGLSEEEIHRRVMTALKLVGLDEDSYIGASPLNLSGGEKRRVALAGILAMEPSFLILDEPTAGLDPHGREAIMEAIHRLKEKSEMSVILVTHSMEEVAKYAEIVYVLNKGKIILSGKPKEVFYNTELLDTAGIKPPASVEITLKLAAHGYSLPHAVNIKDTAKAIARAWRKSNAD